MKEITAYASSSKLAQKLGVPRQTVDYRIRKGYAVKVKIGDHVGYADFDQICKELFVDHSAIKSGWPLGKKRKNNQPYDAQDLQEDRQGAQLAPSDAQA